MMRFQLPQPQNNNEITPYRFSIVQKACLHPHRPPRTLTPWSCSGW